MSNKIRRHDSDEKVAGGNNQENGGQIAFETLA